MVSGYAAWRILLAGGGLSLFYDEWSFVQERQSLSADAILTAHNGHLTAVPALVYQGLFRSVGLDDYTPYRIVVLACHLACVAVVFAYVRSRLSAWPALLAAALVACFGAGSQNLIWAFQIAFLLSVSTAVGALLALDRQSRWGDGAAAALLTVSLASSGLGILAVAATGVRLVTERAWGRLWAVGLPSGLYLGWYLRWGESQAESQNIPATPGYVRDAGGAVWSWMVGLDGRHTAGIFFAGIALMLLVAVVRRRRVELAGLLAGATLTFGFWAVTALSRAQLNLPASSRYLYPGAVFTIVLLAELLRDIRVRPAALMAAAAVVFIAVVGNLEQLDRDGEAALLVSQQTRAELASVELARNSLDPSLNPDWLWMPQVRVGLYLAAVDRYGSPAFTIAEVRAQAPKVRFDADEVLRLGVRSASAPIDAGFGAECINLQTGADQQVEGHTIVLTGPAQLHVRAFADTYSEAPTATVAANERIVVKLPPTEWHAKLSTTGSGSALSCR